MRSLEARLENLEKSVPKYVGSIAFFKVPFDLSSDHFPDGSERTLENYIKIYNQVSQQKVTLAEVLRNWRIFETATGKVYASPNFNFCEALRQKRNEK